MAIKQQLGTMDYAVILMMLLISTAIGFKFRLAKNEQSAAYEYLMAGKNMFLLPVILSISVTLISGLSLIVTPSEVYRYDFQNCYNILGMVIGIVIAVNVFFPVYFRCGVSTSYEFLELRFGKTIKYVVSAAFLLQMLSYTSIVLFPPVLALSAVTDLSIEFSIVTCGIVCTVYCLLGGLKGVLWTDTFQCILMFTFLIIIYVAGIQDAGGLKSTYHKVLMGDKLNIDFSLNFSKRYTFWSVFTSGFLHGLGSYGTSQIEVQRALSLKTVKRAQIAMYVAIIPLSALYVLSNGLGLVMYAVYFNCDPILNKEETGLQKYEQIIPYYLVNRFSSLPGVTGLCIAGIFSGSLSTISSALNSVATVVVLDFVQPLCKSFNLTNSKLLFISKLITFLFGCLCTALPFLMMSVVSIKQLSSSLTSVVLGPILAVFTAGALTRNVSERCALIGFFAGVFLTCCLCYGTLMGGYIEPVKNLGNNCSSAETQTSVIFGTFNSTCAPGNACFTSPVPNTQMETFALYKLSFMWLRAIGFVTSVVTMFICVLLTGWNKEVVASDSKCLSPITRFWTPKIPNAEKVQIHPLKLR